MPPTPVARTDRIRTLGVVVLIVLCIAACARLPRSAPSLQLRVMTYNIQSGSGNLAGTADAIRAQQPDLVALQEVDVHWSARSGFADQAAVLAESLGMQFRFARIYQFPGADAAAPPREYGVALLSRYPIVAFTNHILTRLSTQAEGVPAAPLPGFLEATVDVRGRRIRVYNTHLDFRHDPAVRRQQVAETLAIIGQPVMPTLMFGDFNARPDAPELQPLLARLHDSWNESSDPGLTYPSSVPRTRIDYVLASRGFRVRSATVPATHASDHRPVVVEFTMQ